MVEGPTGHQARLLIYSFVESQKTLSGTGVPVTAGNSCSYQEFQPFLKERGQIWVCQEFWRLQIVYTTSHKTCQAGCSQAKEGGNTW